MPRLLARGLSPEQVSWTTGVPAALVTLISQEIPAPRTVGPRQPSRRA